MENERYHKMGRLIIDGNSVFELDEECLKRRPPSDNCDVDKYMKYESESLIFKKQNDTCENKTQKYLK